MGLFELVVAELAGHSFYLQTELRHFHGGLLFHTDHLLMQLVILLLESFELLFQTGVENIGARCLVFQFFVHLLETLEAFSRFQQVVEKLLC